nr:hypothetical protein [Wolbachia pipientis]
MDTQQEHIYNERIQEFFPLFDKKDDQIYNARVDFNTVKFLTECTDWDWNEDKDKNKACGVILQECNKIKKAEQKLESEVKKRLKEYVDDVAGVSIYGNHASITLGDNKKEFKISEFLNSDFCQKNGISGFSTLHSDGKSGMHGFVAEEGGKKIRHYVVTDGSYEMTLKWYAEGKECEIKIKIDANGVDLVKGDDFSLERLEANRDVKIGGLFLHEIEFREKGQGKSNEVEHDGQDNQALKKSFETFIGSDISRGVGIQATDTTRGIGSQTTIPRSDSENDLGHESQGESSQNKKTPPPVPTGTSSLPPKKDVFDEQGGSKLGSRKPDRSEQIPNNQQQPEIPQQEGNSKSALLQEIRNFKKNNLRHTDVDDREASIERSKENNPWKKLKDKIPYSPFSDMHEHNSDNRGASDAEWEESKQPLSVPKPNSKSDSGYSPQIHAQSQVDPEQSKRSLENIEQSNQTLPENLLKEIRDRSQKDNRGLRQVDSTDKLPQDKEDGLQKNDLADVKTVEGPTVSVSASTPNSISDSGYSSPTHANHKQPQVNPGQLKASLMNVEQRDDTLLTKFTSKLDKETQKFPLKPVDQKEMSEQTKEHLLATGLLKENAAETKINDSGYSSPTYTSHYNFQVSPEQLGKRLETIESKKKIHWKN